MALLDEIGDILQVAPKIKALINYFVDDKDAASRANAKVDSQTSIPPVIQDLLTTQAATNLDIANNNPNSLFLNGARALAMWAVVTAFSLALVVEPVIKSIIALAIAFGAPAAQLHDAISMLPSFDLEIIIPVTIALLGVHVSDTALKVNNK